MSKVHFIVKTRRGRVLGWSGRSQWTTRWSTVKLLISIWENNLLQLAAYSSFMLRHYCCSENQIPEAFLLHKLHSEQVIRCDQVTPLLGHCGVLAGPRCACGKWVGMSDRAARTTVRLGQTPIESLNGSTHL